MKITLYNILFGFVIMLLLYACEKENNPTGLQSGKMNKISDCKSLKSSTTWLETPDTLSCIEYSYDPENSNLSFKHFNTGFNCCPGKIYCNFNFTGDTLIIYEKETTSSCDCNCLYDIEYELEGIAQKKYHVRLMEPYAEYPENIEFEMDLTSGNSGSLCITRKRYPWGL